MATLRSGLISLFILGSAGVPAAAEEAWSASGFENPESALLDRERNVIYISNVAGEPNAKDGNGYISKLSPDGAVQEAKWVTGLNSPKGLAMRGSSLFVSDVDQIAEINIETGEIANTWNAEGAQFLNDVAVDDAGRVYVSDMLANSIYVVENGTVSIWLQDAALLHPNGLYLDGGRLVVAAWGADIQPDFSTKTPGHLLEVNLASKEISPLGSGDPIGNLDGLESDGAGNWLATDWVAGALYRISSDGSSEQLLDLNQGSADLEFVQSEKLAIIPMMMDGNVVAHKVD